AGAAVACPPPRPRRRGAVVAGASAEAEPARLRLTDGGDAAALLPLPLLLRHPPRRAGGACGAVHHCPCTRSCPRPTWDRRSDQRTESRVQTLAPSRKPLRCQTA